jgi:hypothetical protein
MGCLPSCCKRNPGRSGFDLLFQALLSPRPKVLFGDSVNSRASSAVAARGVSHKGFRSLSLRRSGVSRAQIVPTCPLDRSKYVRLDRFTARSSCR